MRLGRAVHVDGAMTAGSVQAISTGQDLDRSRENPATPQPSLASGASTSVPTPRAAATATASPGAAPVPVRASPLAGAPLPVALDGESAVQLNGIAYVIGGIAPDQSSRRDVWAAALPAGPWKLAGRLPMPTHDAAAAALAGQIEVFGGGQTTSAATAWQFDPTQGKARALPSLPRPLSDAAAATVGDTAYLIGGFDDTHFRSEILAWRPGADGYTVAGRLPAGLRYAAAAALGGKVYIFGGLTSNGPTDAILSFNPASGAVLRVGTLAAPTHYLDAAAAPRDGGIWLLGGLTAAGPGDAVWAYRAGQAEAPARIATLPAAVAYGAAVRIGSAVYLIGGRDAATRHTAAVVEIR